jgi:multiple sugar transport system permease protein
MPIISKIGRRSPKVRFLIGSIYLVLIVGGVSMVYPFLLMVAGSTKSAMDVADSDAIPRFLVEDGALYRKHIEGLFNESFDQMQIAYDTTALSFRTLERPTALNGRLAEAWREFLENTKPPHYSYTLGYIRSPVSRGVLPHLLRAFKRRLIERFDGRIERLNQEFNTDFLNWNAFWALPEDYLLRRNKPENDPLALAFREFKESQPLEERIYFSAEGFYKNSFLKSQYTKDIAAYNQTHNTHYSSWAEIHLDRRLPTGPGRTQRERDDWEIFVRTILNLLWIRADAGAEPIYRRFLEAKYGDIGTLNQKYGTACRSFDDVPLIKAPPSEGLVLSDWDAFVQGWNDPDAGGLHVLPAEMIRIHSVDFLFRDNLKEKHGSLESANSALGASFGDWLDICPPQRDFHCLAFGQQRAWLRWEFVRRNYATVIDFIVLHGRGILNTCIYCSLAILAALIVNPLAAYALSRYKPPSAYKVLLFLMLTMAFPPMVTQIPVFLMLRRFDLLNTFWALILPGLAHGYSIFLLKGFFDSLPQELYESAEIDGAGEFRLFWQITMSLSQPILAVIALNAFTAAYSNFMMALLICQDEKMWTLMPWLYQLQLRSGPGVVFASLVIAAIPTFLVFALCQNVIMRGIVVPVEK